MGIQLRQLHPLFGAEVIGLDLGACDAAQVRAIEAAIGRAGLLLFRDFERDDAALARFAELFGPLQNLSKQAGAQSDVVQLTNLSPDGSFLPRDSAWRPMLNANNLWHIDSTYLSPGATYSFLQARIVPSEGGATEYSDTRLAWEALDPNRRAALAGLTADHSILHSRRLAGCEAELMKQYPTQSMPPITRTLVRRHDPSGRNALIIASHIQRVDGLDYESARALVDELTSIASAPERVYRHQWRVGDLVMWDNRCVMHRGTPYPEFDQARDMRSCRVADIGDVGIATAVAA
jgi:alpha-ketoglutarate-dependent 2,4-dichlorophenoxyacetate dioxygenase